MVQDTNKEKRPLLTMTGKDSNGEMFTFLRIYLPNEKAWCFRWAFSVVLPRFFPTTLSRVKFIMSDGDFTEYTQIDACIQNFLKNAQRGRCGWHIVDRGWKMHVPGPNAFNSEHQDIYHEVSSHLKNWMYSWMKNKCET